MPNGLILAIDQGTTGTTCVLYGPDGLVHARAYRPLAQHYPVEGWVEHDPLEIWRGVVSAVRELAAASLLPVVAAGITNQRETTVIWDRNTGEPVHNAIVWQCRRTSEICRRYESERERIREKTGLPLDAYFSATKIRWILERHAGLDAEQLLFGTIDSWLLWRLTKGTVHATDFTNASRTMLFNIHDRRWDPELLDLFGVPFSMVPEARPSMSGFGAISAIRELQGVPVAAIAGDQQAALFGQCCFEPGMMKNTYGTGCFLVMNTGDACIRSRNGLIATLAIDASGRSCYAMEGSVFIGGAIVQWLRDELQMLRHAADSAVMADAVSSNGGVYIVPAFAGLGAPHWNMGARGTITGLTRGASRNHIVRAALESIAYQTHDVFRAMQADTGMHPVQLLADGGAVDNDFLMQFQADILGIPVVKPQNKESTSLGIAFLAGLQSGFWQTPEELRGLNGTERKYSPVMDPPRRNSLLDGWNRALRQAVAV
ncbi:MAG: glycerol kinase GlpK [Chlorobi bacterium]|nr:glycerol kinase GlpK [Chlorobiota bacterium]